MKLDISLLINKRIEELEALPCECSSVQTLEIVDEEDSQPQETKCSRCIELETLKAMCQCGACRECLKYLKNEYSKQLCECTYTIIEETQEDGSVVEKQVLETKCDRCTEIELIDKTLAEYDIYEKAYIPESYWKDCYYINDTIYTPVYQDEILVKTGEQVYNSSIDPQPLRDRIKQFVETYKWEKSHWFEYDGSMQKNESNDIIMMIQSREALQLGIMTQIEWKYPDRRIVVTDHEYFLNMQLMSAMMIQYCFETEKQVIEATKEMTHEQLQAINPKEFFDATFDKIVSSVGK